MARPIARTEPGAVGSRGSKMRSRGWTPGMGGGVRLRGWVVSLARSKCETPLEGDSIVEPLDFDREFFDQFATAGVEENLVDPAAESKSGRQFPTPSIGQLEPALETGRSARLEKADFPRFDTFRELRDRQGDVELRFESLRQVADTRKVWLQYPRFDPGE